MGSVDHSIEIEDEIEDHKKYYLKFHFLWTFFAFSGEDRVKRERVTKEDFILPDEIKVVKYDEKRVAQYWNKINVQQRMLRHFFYNFACGLFIKMIPTILLFVAVYYISYFALYQYYVCALTKNISSFSVFATSLRISTLESTTPAPNIPSNTCQDNGWPKRIEGWKKLEYQFVRILTFLLVFLLHFHLEIGLHK
jgi:hypothetical protein